MRFSLKKIILTILLLAFTALAWMTVSVLKLEKEQQAIARQVYQDEQVRRALERMDSFLYTFLSRENNRPEFQRKDFFTDPSHFSASRTNFVRSYLLLTPEGQLHVLDSTQEKTYGKFPASLQQDQERGKFAHPVIRETPFLPSWQGRDLIFLKQIPQTTGVYTVAIWVDWPTLRDRLLARIKDILPHAGLSPRSAGTAEEGAYSLLAIPASLIPGEVTWSGYEPIKSMNWALALVWLLFLAGGGGLLFLLSKTAQLSSRRAAFVSAVTHELRTPLTNFSLYSEMLDEDYLSEDKRRSYLHLLRAEAKRLTHLVNNVLSYSRIENSRGQELFKDYEAGPLFHSVAERVGNLLESRNFTLDFHVAADAASAMLRTNRTAIEQIIDNLVDNTLKYAAGSRSLIKLELERDGMNLLVLFTDFGPGIDPDTVEHLFVPFFRSAEAAAGNKPGVGLGLALSRDTARMIGGELSLIKTGPEGTSFVLSLPISRQ